MEFQPLDLFSTSPTKEDLLPDFKREKCVNNAPLFAYLKTSDFNPNVYGVVQGCCNSWSCPRCGLLRAKQEYGRIVNGCIEIEKSGHPLYFVTVTCRGKDITAKDADAQYLTWTNRLMDALRLNLKRRNDKRKKANLEKDPARTLHFDVPWQYVAVTERQKRGHPHSHILTTYYPEDLIEGFRKKRNPSDLRSWKQVPAWRSDYLLDRCLSAGLGSEYDISAAGSVNGVARYVAKYMFKDEMFSTQFPKGWRRVRYSQTFPELPDRVTDAFILNSAGAWLSLAKKAEAVTAKGDEAFIQASACLKGTGVSVIMV